MWKRAPSQNRDVLDLNVERKVFQLLEDIDKKGTPWVSVFEHSLELKNLLAEKKGTFI